MVHRRIVCAVTIAVVLASSLPTNAQTKPKQPSSDDILKRIRDYITILGK